MVKMQIVVDKLPEQPKECLFCHWNREYGWICKLFKYEPCYLGKNMACRYLKGMRGEDDENEN